MSDPVLVLRGEKVGLGVVSKEMIPRWVQWINDLEVTRTLGAWSAGPATTEDEEEWYEGLRKRKSEVLFAIYELSTMRPIGSTGLHGVDHRHNTATFGIMIGAKDCWNKGYGTETARLVLDYAFNVLGLHNVMLQVFAFNPRGIRAYEKAGFKLIGRRREARRIGERRYDELFMEALATEFESPVLRRLVEPAG